jgi:cytochrome P450
VAQLPGPTAWPLVGHLLHFDEARVHLQLEDWSRAYGPLYRLRFLRTDVVVLSETDLVAQAFRARPGTWRRFGSIETVAREAGVHGLFSAEGDDWVRQRRLVLRAFDPGHLRRFLPRLDTVIERLRMRWRRAARRGEVLVTCPPSLDQ